MESLSHCCAATDALRHCTCCAGEEEEVWEKRKKSTMGALLGSSLYFTLFLFLSPSSPLSFFLSLPLCEALSLCLLFQAFILFLNTYTHSLTLSLSRTLSLFHVVALSRCRVTYLNYSLDFDIFLVPVAFFQYGLLSMNETDRTCRRHSSLPLSNRLRIGIGRKKTVRWRHSSRIAQGLARDKYLL